MYGLCLWALLSSIVEAAQEPMGAAMPVFLHGEYSHESFETVALQTQGGRLYERPAAFGEENWDQQRPPKGAESQQSAQSQSYLASK